MTHEDVSAKFSEVLKQFVGRKNDVQLQGEIVEAIKRVMANLPDAT